MRYDLTKEALEKPHVTNGSAQPRPPDPGITAEYCMGGANQG